MSRWLQLVDIFVKLDKNVTFVLADIFVKLDKNVAGWLWLAASCWLPLAWLLWLAGAGYIHIFGDVFT